MKVPIPTGFLNVDDPEGIPAETKRLLEGSFSINDSYGFLTNSLRSLIAKTGDSRDEEVVQQYHFAAESVRLGVDFSVPSSLQKLLNQTEPPEELKSEDLRTPFEIIHFNHRVEMMHKLGDSELLFAVIPFIVTTQAVNPDTRAIEGTSFFAPILYTTVTKQGTFYSQDLAAVNLKALLEEMRVEVTKQDLRRDARKRLELTLQAVNSNTIDLADSRDEIKMELVRKAFNAFCSFLALIDTKEIVYTERLFDKTAREKRFTRGKVGAGTTTVLVSPRIYDHVQHTREHNPDNPQVAPHWVRGHWVHFRSERYKAARNKKVWVMPYIKGAGDPNLKKYVLDPKAYKELL